MRRYRSSLGAVRLLRRVEEERAAAALIGAEREVAGRRAALDDVVARRRDLAESAPVDDLAWVGVRERLLAAAHAEAAHRLAAARWAEDRARERRRDAHRAVESLERLEERRRAAYRRERRREEAVQADDRPPPARIRGTAGSAAGPSEPTGPARFGRSVDE